MQQAIPARYGERTRVLVTGATGFIGRHLVRRLSSAGFAVHAGVRDFGVSQQLGPEVSLARFHLADAGSIDRATLENVDCIVHLAGLAHLHGRPGELDSKFAALNSRATEALAQRAAECGVRRFVFVSSIKVNGERTTASPFRALDTPHPEDAYARSKLGAEVSLWRVSENTGLNVVVVRPPLVYGPGVGGNFATLLRAVHASIPLPLGSVNNRRSLVGVFNLASFLELVIGHPASPGRTWLVSDGEDVSVPDLIRLLARLMGRPARLWCWPERLLVSIGALSGDPGRARRLIESLQVDDSPGRLELGWQPCMSLQRGLELTVESFLTARSPKLTEGAPQ